MYIEPNSTIKIYHNVPIDNYYRNTLYFANRTNQNLYFHGQNSTILKYTLTNQSYQRVVKGSMRIAKKADDLYDCNYLAFQNTSFGNKWFYAFITSIEYVNNATSEITFEIDVIQTFLLDLDVKECFIEREHVSLDTIGSNLIDEGLELGDYQFDAINRTGLFNDWGVMVQSPYNENVGLTSVGSDYNGVPSSNIYLVFIGYEDPQTHATKTAGVALKEWVNKMAEKGFTESITTVTSYPKAFCTQVSGDNNRMRPNDNSKNFYANKPSTVGNYTPRNKKLLQYPYNFLGVTTNNGSIAEYKYEYFTAQDDKCVFKVYPDPNTATFMCVPNSYNGMVDNWNEAITMTNLPLCSIDSDTYKIWYAQNKYLLANQALQGTMSTVISGASGNASGVISGVESVINVMAQEKQHQVLPHHTIGTVGSGIGIKNNVQDFIHFNCHIRYEFAQKIDNFFDMYGYKVNRVGVPLYGTRPRWNYVKTNGFTAIGSCPSDDLTKISNIFNNGITFWKNANDVGNYSLDNSPTS